MRTQIIKFFGLFTVLTLISAISAVSALSCNSGRNFNDPAEWAKQNIAQSIVEAIAKSDCYEEQVCNINIKFGRREVEIQEASYAVFFFLTNVDVGIPQENLNEFLALKDLKGPSLLQKLGAWQFYEYSPQDETGFIALLHNTKTDKIIYLINSCPK